MLPLLLPVPSPQKMKTNKRCEINKCQDPREVKKKFFMLCVGSDGIFVFLPYMSDPPATTVSHNQTSNVKTCLLFYAVPWLRRLSAAFCAWK